MDVISNEERLSVAFNAVYRHLLDRKTLPFNLVYQCFGSAWNITGMGKEYSVNIGECERNERDMLYFQARKPKQPSVQGARRICFNFSQTLEISFLTSYYLLAAQGMVNLPELFQKYPEFSDQTKTQLRHYIGMIDLYLNT